MNFTSWKTTVTGVVSGLAMVLQSLGVVEMSQELQNAFVLVLIFIIGYFATEVKAKSETKTVEITQEKTTGE